MHVLIAVKYQKPVNTLTSLEMSKLNYLGPVVQRACGAIQQIQCRSPSSGYVSAKRTALFIHTSNKRGPVFGYLVYDWHRHLWKISVIARLFGVHGFLSLSEVYVILA